MRISSMTDVQLEARRELRERAFQALMSLEYEKDIVEACRFAYLYDKDMTNDSDVEIPAFLLNLVMGVEQSKNELDDKLSQYLKEGWTLERLTLIEKNILRLGLFEMTEFDTPQLVAINEAIELSKKFSDEKSSKFINGILSKFITE
ncbi:transcription antitermination factor NusB [Streptococcus periodonticum]|uniref:Transcription antitermination protein NusB n=2 Tax=Streptococcus periodonticum TaxID=2490633 RepID=A0A3S9MSZ9_9STRE|nr:transcription antitermination factor NusB [Streptococcus periodonticum]